jgi:folate-binding protein YgfZ
MPGSVALQRGVVAVSGEDRVSFLQGLVSNDVRRAGADRAIFAALLTPQGKFLHDFHIVDAGDRLLLETDAGRGPELVRRLRVYRLRSKVEIADATESLCLVAVPDPAAPPALGLPSEPGSARALDGGGIAFVDARLPALGVRLLLPGAGVDAALAALGLVPLPSDAWDRHRLALGVPDGSRDLETEKATLIESNYDELHAIDWQKGCYMGQELTARTKYRGLVKRRLVPVAIDGVAPGAGTPLFLEGRELGEMRSSLGDRGMALVRLEALADPGMALVAGTTRIRPRRPAWMAGA